MAWISAVDRRRLLDLEADVVALREELQQERALVRELVVEMQYERERAREAQQQLLEQLGSSVVLLMQEVRRHVKEPPVPREYREDARVIVPSYTDQTA
jgi:hypothetical protein